MGDQANIQHKRSECHIKVAHKVISLLLYTPITFKLKFVILTVSLYCKNDDGCSGLILEDRNNPIFKSEFKIPTF